MVVRGRLRGRMGVRAVAVLAALVAFLLVVSAVPAAAFEVHVVDSQRVIGGLTHQRLVVRLANGGLARGDLLRWHESDDSLSLRPRLARGTALGVEDMRTQAGRAVSSGGVAGTNGGFYLKGESYGAPNGLFLDHGRLVGGQSLTHTGVPVRRPSLGISAAGALVMDRLWFSIALDRPDGQNVVVDGINRALNLENPPPGGELVLFTPLYGGGVRVPTHARLLVVDDAKLGSSGTATVQVQRVITDAASHRAGVVDGTNILVAFGPARDRIAGINVGDTLRLTPTVAPQDGNGSVWQSLQFALPAGNLLIKAGQPQTTESWSTEAFPQEFIVGRHPRTAIGRRANGELLLLTIDGRQSGWSSGMLLRELTQTLQSLGAVDALNLDGGGSTTMIIDRGIVNRPSEDGRRVGSSLWVHTDLPEEARDIGEGACPRDRVRSAAFDDTGDTVHTAAIDCLAWWGVTEGVAPRSYAPRGNVSRAQMASLVARWMDETANRDGDARRLPASGSSRFDDVDPAGVHGTAIARLADAGIVQGRAPGRYAPLEPVSRAQMATFIVRAIEYLNRTSLPVGRDTFVDDNHHSAHESSINRLNAIGVVAGTGGFGFSPDAYVRRDAVASFVMRAADAVVSG